MDMQTAVAPEEVLEDRDIKETRTDTEKINEAKKVAKRVLSEKQAASLAKAREAKKMKAEYMKSAPPDGSVAPNQLQLIQDNIEALRGEWKQMHMTFQDLQKHYARESALQEQQVVQPSSKKALKLPGPSEVYVDVDDDEDVAYPSDFNKSQKRKAPLPTMSSMEEDDYRNEIRQVKRRNMEGYQKAFYFNQNMEKRAANKPEMGQRPTIASDVLYF
jgi:hypothetical protein